MFDKIKGRIDDLYLSFKGIRFYQNFLKKSQFYKRGQLRDYQYEQLNNLWKSAFEGTKYYRDLFWEYDFDPYKDFSDISDIKKLPVLTKEVARKNQHRLANDDEIERALELRTSGTTGEVFKEFVSRKQWEVEQGIVWRHWKWLGYNFRDKMAIIRSYVPDPGDPLWKLDRTRNFLYFSAYHLNLENAKRYLLKLQSWEPQVIRGYPSSLYILAKMSEELGIDLPPSKGVLTASEMVLPHYKETIEKAFKAKIFDWYGQAETTVTMNECDAHEGLHINMEYGLCELVESPELNDDERKIIATNLHNTAMPLIRYDTGDVAKVYTDSKTCSCGRTLPLIRKIIGRSDDLLYGPDGRVIPSVNLYTMMYHYDDVISFQFIQDDINSIELRLEAQHYNSELESQLKRDIKNRFGDNISVSITNDVEFVQSEEGKKNPIISNVEDVFK